MLPLRSLCGGLHKKPLHGIVNSFGLNESSFCVTPTSKKKGGRGEGGGRGGEAETHSSPSELLLLALQLCLSVLQIPDDIIYNASAQTVNKKII